MAGMMPIVEMQYRRRSKTYSHRTHEDNSHFHGNYPSSLRSWIDPSMDEAALIARGRLEEKLGYFRPSSNRLNGVQAYEGRADQLTTTARDRSDDQHLVSRILGRRPWNFQLINSSTSSKSKGGQQLICVVCLEGCRAEDQQVMELPCSHKFHSKCLNPWLASHPNCPSCRSPVQI
ncbi:E3 ubiquitin-protein ligase RING1-like isoform X2 [Rhododendron vialii]|uniref:E3 ubiquitin-protein ligase RING1-like isoform X2 n=1 Tax=Rhododendron vialii TaxID=182163 RepID=UPI00266002EB|nr:E3 ubiquitin-protein ligase RING1-like isoform X2 [Rhododendron vialii]